MDDNRPDTPPVPGFLEGPGVTSNIDFLTDIGQRLGRGDFPDFLRPLVSLNPEATQAAVGLATRGIERTRDNAQQSIINQLEANNQLTSSVAVNRLSDLNEQFAGDIADVNTRFFLADVERSLANIGNLFGTGLNTSQAAAGLGLEFQQQRNVFELQRFNNQLAANQLEAQGGGGLGALGGAVGTGLGFLAGGPIGAGIGGAIGGGIGEFVSPSQTGLPGLAFVAGGLNFAASSAGRDSGRQFGLTASQQGILNRDPFVGLTSLRGNAGTGISNFPLLP